MLQFYSSQCQQFFHTTLAQKVPMSYSVGSFLLQNKSRLYAGFCFVSQALCLRTNRPAGLLVKSPTDLRTNDAAQLLVWIARILSILEPKVQLRNYSSVEQIQDNLGSFLLQKQKPALCRFLFLRTCFRLRCKFFFTIHR